ncbi:MAG TPA: hypothetical protein VNM47_18945 [Terriglobia bacterium]|nr:hypothetical protein [Terriglobia bacterium]
MTETELSRRLAKLERDNRRLKHLGLAALLIVVIVGTIGATQPIPQVIKAHTIQVTDAAGKVRFELKSDEIRFFDGLGVPKLAMGIASGEPPLLLRGETGTIGLDTTSRSGMPGIWLLDRKGKTRAAMQMVGKGTVISLHDADGDGKVTLNQFPDGSLISLADGQGFDMDLGSTATASPNTGASEHTSAASIVMFGNDKEHHVIWKAP